MRVLSLLALLSLAPGAFAAAQAIAVPVRCAGACLARPRGGLTIDTVAVWAILERGHATTYVSHRVRNDTDEWIDTAFFFPLPPGATLERTMVYGAGRLETYNEWSDSAQSRREADAIVRATRGSPLRAYAGMNLVHVRVPSIAPHGTRQVQIGYTQPLRTQGGTVTYRYPLGARAAPPGELTLRMTVETETGFAGFHSPSHPVQVSWGTETARCPPQARCGFMGVPSRRVKEVRLALRGADDLTRDFVLVYTPAAPDGHDAEPLP
ncbi:MAG TPA: VIT domain-containing protein [Longimicrobium sp.]